jgi:hypothetical protein
VPVLRLVRFLPQEAEFRIIAIVTIRPSKKAPEAISIGGCCS